MALILNLSFHFHISQPTSGQLCNYIFQIILSAASGPLQPAIKQRVLRSLQQCAFTLRAVQIVSSRAAAAATTESVILKQFAISRIPLVCTHTLGHRERSVTSHPLWSAFIRWTTDCIANLHPRRNAKTTLEKQRRVGKTLPHAAI